VYRITSPKAATALNRGTATIADFIIVQGVVAWDRQALEVMLAEGQLEIATAACAPLTGQLWDLATVTQGSDPPLPALSDGTGLWWLSWQQGSAGLQAPASNELADRCLDEWLRWHAGLKKEAVEGTEEDGGG
jgi:hypothetical protein